MSKRNREKERDVEEDDAPPFKRARLGQKEKENGMEEKKDGMRQEWNFGDWEKDKENDKNEMNDENSDSSSEKAMSPAIVESASTPLRNYHIKSEEHDCIVPNGKVDSRDDESFESRMRDEMIDSIESSDSDSGNDNETENENKKESDSNCHATRSMPLCKDNGINDKNKSLHCTFDNSILSNNDNRVVSNARLRKVTRKRKLSEANDMTPISSGNNSDWKMPVNSNTKKWKRMANNLNNINNNNIGFKKYEASSIAKSNNHGTTNISRNEENEKSWTSLFGIILFFVIRLIFVLLILFALSKVFGEFEHKTMNYCYSNKHCRNIVKTVSNIKRKYIENWYFYWPPIYHHDYDYININNYEYQKNGNYSRMWDQFCDEIDNTNINFDCKYMAFGSQLTLIGIYLLNCDSIGKGILQLMLINIDTNILNGNDDRNKYDAFDMMNGFDNNNSNKKYELLTLSQYTQLFVILISIGFGIKSIKQSVFFVNALCGIAIYQAIINDQTDLVIFRSILSILLCFQWSCLWKFVKTCVQAIFVFAVIVPIFLNAVRDYN